MKKISIYAFMGAIALTGAVGFSSCSSSSSDEVVNNPDYNPETGMVKTQFAISIPTSSKQSSTRMSADGAPNDGVFKGMKEIKLYPISTAEVTSASSITAPITLDDISATGANSFNAKGENDNSFNGKVYNDVSIPIGTKAFLFYGEITNEEGGDLTPTYAPVSATSGTANEINFTLKAIQDKTFANISSDEQGAAVLTAVNAIYNKLAEQEASAEGASYAQTTQLNAVKQSLEAIHAGSANSVRAFMQNIYNKLTAINTAADGTYAPAVQTIIETYFDKGGTSGNNTLTWKTANTFPNNIGLPDGAIGMEYSSTAETKISFKSVLAGGSAQPELNTYVKPASLFYTVNTTIHTSTAAQVSNYADKTTWAQVVALYNSDTQVKGDTRGIVLDKSIQYGVGRLKSQVKLYATTLKANDADGTELTVTVPAGGYTVSGILIGSQRAVGWDFVPKEGATEYTIYDPVQTGGASVRATTTASTANYTLALQTDKDAEVKAVVELVNDGDPFYGYNNQLIPSGSKFYLVGTLNPTAATGVTTYDAEDDHMNRVFCQDVETTVVFTIGETSLKKAYNTIPDLRSAQMELGLSVDLSWTSGLSFDVTF